MFTLTNIDAQIIRQCLCSFKIHSTLRLLFKKILSFSKIWSLVIIWFYFVLICIALLIKKKNDFTFQWKKRYILTEIILVNMTKKSRQDYHVWLKACNDWVIPFSPGYVITFTVSEVKLYNFLTFTGRSCKVNDHIHLPHWLQVNLQAKRYHK